MKKVLVGILVLLLIASLGFSYYSYTQQQRLTALLVDYKGKIQELHDSNSKLQKENNKYKEDIKALSQTKKDVVRDFKIMTYNNEETKFIRDNRLVKSKLYLTSEGYKNFLLLWRDKIVLGDLDLNATVTKDEATKYLVSFLLNTENVNGLNIEFTDEDYSVFLTNGQFTRTTNLAREQNLLFYTENDKGKKEYIGSNKLTVHEMVLTFKRLFYDKDDFEQRINLKITGKDDYVSLIDFLETLYRVSILNIREEDSDIENLEDISLYNAIKDLRNRSIYSNVSRLGVSGFFREFNNQFLISKDAFKF